MVFIPPLTPVVVIIRASGSSCSVIILYAFPSSSPVLLGVEPPSVSTSIDRNKTTALSCLTGRPNSQP